jgi:hypothetical protein
MDSTPEPTNLQFDRADFGSSEEAAAAASTCKGCGRPIADTYFEVNGQMVCPGCRDVVMREQATTAGVEGVFKAIAAGLGAGIVGAIIYYAVAEITGLELALVSILVGYLVGRAVRWASGGRGGRVYQVIAVVLTYLAIVGSYAPFVLEGVKNAAARSGGAAAAPDSPLALAIAVFLIVLLIVVSPFIAGVQNIIGWIIIAVALWEAWKITKRATFTVSGPFNLAIRPPAPVPNPATAPAPGGLT